MLFLILYSTNINFLKKEFRYKIYTIKKHFLTIQQIKLVGKKELTILVFNLKNKFFKIYIISFISLDLNIHLFY